MRGVVIIPQIASSFRGAVLRLSIERLPFVDACAEIVRQQFIKDVAHEQGKTTRIPFDVQIPDVDLGRLNLRAHVSQSGNTEIAKGDLLSQQSYPVERQSHGRLMTVHVEQV